MPLLTRWFIKAALLYFIAALIVGVALLARPLLDLPPLVAALNPVYFHLLMVGWVTQLIIGVVYWMFPKFTRERPRRSETLAWATFFLLNAGLLLRVIAEPLVSAAPLFGWLLAASAVLQLIAGWAFVVNSWSRVKSR